MAAVDGSSELQTAAAIATVERWIMTADSGNGVGDVTVVTLWRAKRWKGCKRVGFMTG